MKKKDEIKVCLVGSSGGHLTHLYMLKPFWKDKNRFWVTFDKEDARSLLEGEKVYPCYFPTNRSIKALIKNTKIAWDVLHKEKPDLIISCGAAVAVPFFYIGKMMGAKLVYQNIILEALTQPGDLFYDASFGWGLYDFIQSEDDDLVRLEIAQRARLGLQKREVIVPESIEIDVGFSDDTFRLRCSFQFADEEEPRELNVVISAVGVEVITT